MQVDNTRLNTIFSRYDSKKDISKKILESFIQMQKNLKGFLIDDQQGAVDKKTGIISDCMALSTFMELYSIEADISDYHKKIFKLVENIINRIYPNCSGCDDLEHPIYDASPYVFNNPSKNIIIDSYVETISKVLITMVDFRDYIMGLRVEGKNLKFNIKVGNEEIITSERLEKILEKLIIDAITNLVDACIINDNPFEYTIDNEKIERHGLSSTVEYKGWTFIKVPQQNYKDCDISIYYTYHATNAFLAFYQSFNNFFDSYFENKEYYVEEYKKEERAIYDCNKRFFDKNLELLKKFRYCTVCAGRYIEMMLNKNNVDLAFNYVNKDFTSVSLETVCTSQDNNYVVNTLFVMAILINAGLDDDYNFKNKQDYFYDQINYSLNNVKKVYELLKRRNREIFIDSYTLALDEKYPTDYNLVVNALRKGCKSIELYNLVPLYCNTYSTISKYLIMFPQKEMRDIYNWIMENRMEENDMWLWSTNGFNINNNLYYIFALENFYYYYDMYEAPFAEADEINASYEKLKKNYEDDKDKEVSDKIKKYEAEIKKYQSLYEGKTSKLDEEVINLVDSHVEKAIANYLEKLIDASKNSAIINWRLKEGIYDDDKPGETKKELLELNNQFQNQARLLFEMSNAINNPKILRDSGSLTQNCAGKSSEEIKELINDRLNSKLEDKLKGE